MMNKLSILFKRFCFSYLFLFPWYFLPATERKGLNDANACKNRKFYSDLGGVFFYKHILLEAICGAHS